MNRLGPVAIEAIANALVSAAESRLADRAHRVLLPVAERTAG